MSTPTDIDDRLRSAHEQVEGPDPATMARVLALLDSAIASEARPAVRARRAPRWRPALAAAAVLGILAASAAALLPGNSDNPAAPDEARADLACLRPAAGSAPGGCLRALGRVAEERAPVPAGQVIYQRNVFTISVSYVDQSGNAGAEAQDAAYAIQRTVPEEMWLAADGSGRYEYGRESAPRPAAPADKRAWRAAGSPDLEKLGPQAGGWGPKVQNFGKGEMDRSLIFNSNLEAVLPAEDPLSVLPNDPDALAEFLERAASKQRPGGPKSDISNTLGTNVTTFLRYPRTPPHLRSALLDVFATLPGSKLLGKVRDGAGRPAAGIQLPPNVNDGSDVVVFEPATARLLGQGQSDGSGGVRWLYSYEVESGTVGRIGERP